MKPVLISVPVAGLLAGLSLPTAYRLAPTWPVARMGGRRRIVTSEFERLVGRVFTAEEIATAAVQAKAISRELKAKYLPERATSHAA